MNVCKGSFAKGENHIFCYKCIMKKIISSMERIMDGLKTTLMTHPPFTCMQELNSRSVQPKVSSELTHTHKPPEAF